MLTDEQQEEIRKGLEKEETGSFFHRRRIRKKKKELKNYMSELDIQLLEYCNSMLRKELSEIDSHIDSINKDTIEKRRNQPEES